jgi:hypothetical protein
MVLRVGAYVGPVRQAAALGPRLMGWSLPVYNHCPKGSESAAFKSCSGSDAASAYADLVGAGLGMARATGPKPPCVPSLDPQPVSVASGPSREAKSCSMRNCFCTSWGRDPHAVKSCVWWHEARSFAALMRAFSSTVHSSGSGGTSWACSATRWQMSLNTIRSSKNGSRGAECGVLGPRRGVLLGSAAVESFCTKKGCRAKVQKDSPAPFWAVNSP